MNKKIISITIIAILVIAFIIITVVRTIEYNSPGDKCRCWVEGKKVSCLEYDSDNRMVWRERSCTFRYGEDRETLNIPELNNTLSG